MNERIRDLKEQSLVWSIETLDPDALNDNEWGVAIDEKFAELIVQECSRVIVNGGYWSGGPLGPKRQCTPPEIATMIKEHFGVEL
jgi:hypothetical protein